MKDTKILNEILEGVQSISKRVSALEVASKHECACQQKKRNFQDPFSETYPDGYMTVGDLYQKAPHILEEHGSEMLSGMVIGDVDWDAIPMGYDRPIVPMIFHEGELGYCAGLSSPTQLAFTPLRKDLPVIIGSAEQPMGMYVPFDASEHGIDVAMEVCQEIKQAAIVEREADEFAKALGTIRPPKNYLHM